MIENIVEVLSLSLAVASVSFIVARTKITEPLRKWVKKKSTWAGTGINCPLCVSVWVSLGAELVYRPRVFEHFYVIDLLTTLFVMVALSAFWIGVMKRSIFTPEHKITIDSPTPLERKLAPEALDKVVAEIERKSPGNRIPPNPPLSI